MDFVRMLGEEIEGCDSLSELLSIAHLVYGMRRFQGVREYSIPQWRRKARSFVPGIQDKVVVAVDVDSHGSIDLGRPYISATGCRQWTASDKLASIAMQVALIGGKCVLVSDDESLWQVLFKSICIRTNNEYRNAQWLMAHHRIKPTQVVDWVILQEIGIPRQQASEWLQAFGDFVGVVDGSGSPAVKRFFEGGWWDRHEALALKCNAPIKAIEEEACLTS